MKRFINILLLMICILNATLILGRIINYYFGTTETQIINPKLGGYEFTLWFMLIPTLTALYYTLKELEK